MSTLGIFERFPLTFLLKVVTDMVYRRGRECAEIDMHLPKAGLVRGGSTRALGGVVSAAEEANCLTGTTWTAAREINQL